MNCKENIIKAAVQIISNNGLNFSMDELASKLKMSKRTVYEQVSSKENLVIECMESLKLKFDAYYEEVLNQDNLCYLDKFEKLICFFDKDWFMSRTHRMQIAKSNELIDNKIEEVRYYVLDKAVELLDKHYENNITLVYNKEVFKSIYLNSLISLAEECRFDSSVDFKESQQLIISNLINGIVSTDARFFGGVSLQRLLSRSNMGIIVFRYSDKFEPIYISPGYNELFEKLKDSDSFYYVNKTNEIEENLKAIFAERKHINFDCELENNGNKIYYSLKALPIKWQLYNDVYLAVVTDVTETKNRELKLEISEKKFDLALKQTSVYIWEYNFENQTLVFSDALREIYDLNTPVITKITDFFFGNRIIHPDYNRKFEKFYRGMNNGQKSGESKIKMIDKFGNYRLFKISYKTIFDKDEKPNTAVGVVTAVNNNVGVVSKFEQEEQMISLLKNEITFGIQYNISSDTVEKVFGTHPFVNAFSNTPNFDDIANILLSSISNDGDYDEISRLFSKKALYDFVDENKQYHSAYLRVKDSQGNISWMNLVFRFFVEPFTGDDQLFAYLLDVDHKHKLELKLPEKVEYDITTKLYVQSTFKRMVNFAVSNEEDVDNDCAFIIIECINLPTIKMQYGLDVAEKVLVHFSRVISLCCTNRYLVGELEDNRLAIFVPKTDNLYELRKRVEEIVALAHNSYVLSDNEEKIAKIYFSIFASSLERANFNYLYDKCSKQLEALKLQEDEIIDSVDNIDSYVNYTSYDYDQTNENNYSDDSNKITSLVTTLYQEIISYKDSGDIINETLKLLNYYYSSYRCSVFTLSSNNELVNLKYEFTVGDVLSFDKVTFPIDEIPGLQYASTRQEPIVIKTNYSQDELLNNYYKRLRENNINLFYAIPLIEKNETIGFLTVANATDHLGELTLLRVFAQVINNELVKQSLVEDKRLNNEVDFISKLYNYHYFRKVIARYKNSALSSLGVACIKLNDLRQINLDHGIEYGDSIIMQIADLLREQFRIDSIFRIDSEVFEIVVPDIDYETFINRFNLTINNINQLRKGLVSTGHTWTDTDIDIDKLINHAEELMIINKDSKNAAEIFDAQDEHLANLNDALNRNWFTFFLQPKVDLKTNKVSCSESLVRMVHPTYGVISPAKIIPILEKNKMVSVVDFYVLELVCQTLKRWKDEGRVLLPISVNYSRVTLLENDIVERTKDVIEKYGVDKSLIEIEITETIGNMEQKKISEIAEKFIAAGVNLAIDDFGSKYSSLSTLSTVPFNVVKVDKSIINDLVINPRSQIIVEQIINICKQLNMKSVAEGIETERQWKEVKRLGFDLGQGYFFEKPISIKEFEEKFMKVMK